MSDTALFASALTALVDGAQCRWWGPSAGAGGRTASVPAEWHWDAAARRWQPQPPALDQLAQCRARLRAAAAAARTAVPPTPRRPHAPTNTNARGAVLAADGTWVAQDGRPCGTALDDIADLEDDQDDELPPWGAALAPGPALVAAFRAAQDHHGRDMHQWLTRPDGSSTHPDTEDDILLQLLTLAEQHTQTLLLRSSTTS